MKRRVDAKRLLLCLASGCGIGVVYALAFRGRYQTAYVLLIDALHTGGTCLLLLGLLRAALNLGLFDSVAYGFRRMHAVNRRARGEEMPEEQAEDSLGSYYAYRSRSRIRRRTAELLLSGGFMVLARIVWSCILYL